VVAEARPLQGGCAGFTQRGGDLRQ
jgi:hypothetical protein